MVSLAQLSPSIQNPSLHAQSGGEPLLELDLQVKQFEED